MKGWLLGVINWIGDILLGPSEEFVSLQLAAGTTVANIDFWLINNVPWITDVSKYPRLADWLSTHPAQVGFHPFGIFRD